MKYALITRSKTFRVSSSRSLIAGCFNRARLRRGRLFQIRLERDGRFIGDRVPVRRNNICDSWAFLENFRYFARFPIGPCPPAATRH